MNQIQKFFARLCLVECTGEITGRSNGVLFLYPTHLHSHVFSLHHNHYTQRVESFLYTLLDLQSHAFLYL